MKKLLLFLGFILVFFFGLNDINAADDIRDCPFNRIGHFPFTLTNQYGRITETIDGGNITIKINFTKKTIEDYSLGAKGSISKKN